jgi:hypothetical protein
MRAVPPKHRSPQRRPYRNREGDSPIEAWEAGRGYVRIWFRGNPLPYRYTSRVAELAQLARDGRGLATFIGRHRHALRFTRS